MLFQPLIQAPSSNVTPCQPSVTAYSLPTQLPAMSTDVMCSVS